MAFKPWPAPYLSSVRWKLYSWQVKPGGCLSPQVPVKDYAFSPGRASWGKSLPFHVPPTPSEATWCRNSIPARHGWKVWGSLSVTLASTHKAEALPQVAGQEFWALSAPALIYSSSRGPMLEEASQEGHSYSAVLRQSKHVTQREAVHCHYPLL